MNTVGRKQISPQDRELILSGEAWSVVNNSTTAGTAAKNIYIEVPTDGYLYYLEIGGDANESEFSRSLIEDVTVNGSAGTQVTPVLKNRAHTTAFPGLAGTNMVFAGGTTIYTTYAQPRGGVRFDTGCSPSPTMFPLVSGKKYIVKHLPTASTTFTILVNIFRVSLGKPLPFTALVYPVDVLVPILYNKLESGDPTITSTNGPDLTNNGNATFAACKFNNGIVCYDAAKYASVTDIALTAEMTIEFWFKAHKASSAYSNNFVIFVPSYLIYLVFSNNSDVGFLVGMAAGETKFEAPTFANNDLVHVAYLFSESKSIAGGKSVALYVNGTRITTLLGGSDANSITVPTPATLQIGALGGGATADAIIDNIKIWDFLKTDFSDRNVEA